MFTQHPSIPRVLAIFFNITLLLALLIGSGAFPAPARAASTITVTTSADNTTADAFCSLREAIANANSDAASYPNCAAGSGNDTIVFAAGVSAITLAAGLPTITDADGLTISAGSGNVTLSGNNSVRVFMVNSGGALTLQNMTVMNGNTASSGAGASVNSGSTLSIIHSTFTGNHAEAGGAVLNGGTLTITNSTFSNNSATNDGGGVDNFGGIVTIVNSTFANNSANYGGGLLNNTGTATILNSTFSGNSATTSGGALGVWKSGSAVPSTTVRNTILANSPAGGDCWNGLGAGMGTLAGANNIIEVTPNCAAIATSSSDPNLGSLTGSPAYFPLASPSPAIDSGDDPTCAAPPVNHVSQNAIPRPQGAHCEIGSFEQTATLTFYSTGAQDGWVLESSEASGLGGTLESAAITFQVGDDVANKQYRAVLHFDTSGLADTAVLTKATLKVRKQGVVGTDPFTTHGGLRVDIRQPFLGSAAALQPGDFQAAPGASAVAIFDATPAGSWYSAMLNATGRAQVSSTGTTQLRLRFVTDDNNDLGADFVKFFSGNYATVASRPTLVIEYYVP